VSEQQSSLGLVTEVAFPSLQLGKNAGRSFEARRYSLVGLHRATPALRSLTWTLVLAA